MAHDIIRDPVKNALIKDGWTITHDPFTIKYGNNRVYADLAAERILAAERQGEKIVVEIKSFVGLSAVHEFEVALGQYVLYQEVLTFKWPEYKLYLAVSDVTYMNMLQQDLIDFILQRRKIPVIVVDINIEEVVQWIN